MKAPRNRFSQGVGGATTINYKLQEQVLREVFATPKRLRKDRSRRLDTPPTSPALPPETAAKDRRPSTMQSFPSLKKKIDKEEGVVKVRGSLTSASSLDLRKIITTDPRNDSATIDESMKESSEKLRRRYSAGNMRDASEGSDKHSSDTDHEDQMFQMDEEPHKPHETGPRMDVTKSVVPTYAQARQNWAERCYEIERTKRSQQELNPPIMEESNGTTRAEWFLLIENLTKNMIRPCVLDLKMGTRQYGYELQSPDSLPSRLILMDRVHSSPEKRASQQKK